MVNVFEDDFKKLHTPQWWQELLETSGLVQVEGCREVEEAEVLYEEMIRCEHEQGSDPFEVRMSLAQMEWGRDHQPRMTLFVITARKPITSG